MQIKNTEDVEKTVEKIKATVGDDEVQHSIEDKLHQAVLTEVAACSHCERCSALAKAALKTMALDFARWCA